MSDWVSFVKEADFLQSVDVVKATNPSTKEVIEIQVPNAAKAENGALFRPQMIDGSLTISVSDPDKETIRLAKKIAKLLNGNVVGDEGEEY